MSSDDAASDADFRWQAWFQRSDEAVFILSARRRLVFANHAWEKATGLLLKEVRGLPCRRRPRRVLADKTELILGALAPPREAWQGRPCESRRLLPAIGRGGTRVLLAFLPVGAGEKLLGVVGVVKMLEDGDGQAGALSQPGAPLSETCLAYRERRRWTMEHWEGEAPALVRLREQARLAASRPGLPLLILGDKGCGKESLARTIHQLSPWRERFFARVDCERVPPHAVADLLEAMAPISNRRRVEAAAADANQPPLGVLLLKQPSALPRELQSQLAELLEEEEPGIWLMASLRGDAEAETSSGRLLDALYYRLSALTLRPPPLRERRTELPHLVDVFSRRIEQAGGAWPGLSEEALDLLRLHAWPRNLHELSEVLLQAARQSGGARIEPVHLPLYLKTSPVPQEQRLPLDQTLETVERRMIETALRLANGNKKKASDLLGIWRPRLLRRIEALGIEAPEESGGADEQGSRGTEERRKDASRATPGL